MLKLVNILFLLLGAFSINPTNIKYDFSKPELNIVLPKILHEISGLAIIDSNTIACIQDENGVLFMYDLKNHSIKSQYTFGLNGDYEGITLMEQTLYILRSDGVLFELNNYKSSKPKVKTYATNIASTNNEGLCYDAANNRLLIGAKGKINKDALNKDTRCVYEFDLKTKTLNQKPVFNFNVSNINIFAKSKGITFPWKKNKKGVLAEAKFKLNTSEIAIHPVTKQLFILSATDHCIFTFNMNGNLEDIEQLNSDLFNKAEGLSFFNNGDLLISNEGQSHQPTLLRFNYQY